MTSVYPNKCTARVKFEDADDLISAELQVVVRGSLNNKDYWMPKSVNTYYVFLQNKKWVYRWVYLFKAVAASCKC
ncbi:hypothetical protein JS44_08570 [Anoxybacillus flavithermus]|uniref:Uncharacterized protein n=1 Tax=Anoxybacillus flavithermus TaxID=33934 RepID=A0A094IXJ9_9BACL|nr:hypothetical protein JS44_08570 [Anoxybacillus flavithermus]